MKIGSGTDQVAVGAAPNTHGKPDIGQPETSILALLFPELPPLLRAILSDRNRIGEEIGVLLNHHEMSEEQRAELVLQCQPVPPRERNKRQGVTAL